MSGKKLLNCRPKHGFTCQGITCLSKGSMFQHSPLETLVRK